MNELSTEVRKACSTLLLRLSEPIHRMILRSAFLNTCQMACNSTHDSCEEWSRKLENWKPAGSLVSQTALQPEAVSASLRISVKIGHFSPKASMKMASLS